MSTRPAASGGGAGGRRAGTLQPGPDARRRSRRIRLTPGRLLVLAAILLGGVLLLFGLVFDRGQETQLTFVVAGLGLLGCAFLALAAIGGLAVVRLGAQDDEAAAFWAALFGGLCAIAAAGCLAGAFIFLVLGGG